jgi:hypothetical protein
MITGILKEPITVDGITYKKGETVTVARNTGLDKYFETVKKNEEVKDYGTIKADR